MFPCPLNHECIFLLFPLLLTYKKWFWFVFIVFSSFSILGYFLHCIFCILTCIIDLSWFCNSVWVSGLHFMVLGIFFFLILSRGSRYFCVKLNTFLVCYIVQFICYISLATTGFFFWNRIYIHLHSCNFVLRIHNKLSWLLMAVQCSSIPLELWILCSIKIDITDCCALSADIHPSSIVWNELLCEKGGDLTQLNYISKKLLR